MLSFQNEDNVNIFVVGMVFFVIFGICVVGSYLRLHYFSVGSEGCNEGRLVLPVYFSDTQLCLNPQNILGYQFQCDFYLFVTNGERAIAVRLNPGVLKTTTKQKITK